MSTYDVVLCSLLYLFVSFELTCNWLSFCRRVTYSTIRNDTEHNVRYVKVLDPRAAEISFVRTSCEKKQALYVSCGNLGMFIFRD